MKIAPVASVEEIPLSLKLSTLKASTFFMDSEGTEGHCAQVSMGAEYKVCLVMQFCMLKDLFFDTWCLLFQV